MCLSYIVRDLASLKVGADAPGRNQVLAGEQLRQEPTALLWQDSVITQALHKAKIPHTAV